MSQMEYGAPDALLPCRITRKAPSSIHSKDVRAWTDALGLGRNAAFEISTSHTPASISRSLSAGFGFAAPDRLGRLTMVITFPQSSRRRSVIRVVVRQLQDHLIAVCRQEGLQLLGSFQRHPIRLSFVGGDSRAVGTLDAVSDTFQVRVWLSHVERRNVAPVTLRDSQNAVVIHSSNLPISVRKRLNRHASILACWATPTKVVTCPMVSFASKAADSNGVETKVTMLTGEIRRPDRRRLERLLVGRHLQPVRRHRQDHVFLVKQAPQGNVISHENRPRRLGR